MVDVTMGAEQGDRFKAQLLDRGRHGPGGGDPRIDDQYLARLLGDADEITIRLPWRYGDGLNKHKATLSG